MANNQAGGRFGSQEPLGSDRLDSWKEIAAYLKREVRTVQRWERIAGLPIHRLQIDKLGSVYAYKSELDAWCRERGQRIEQKPPEVAGSAHIKAQSDVALPVPATPQWKIAAGALIALLILAGAAASLIRSHRTPLPQPKIMLAVLPFTNLSGDEAQEYFSDGLTDEMITRLGGLQPDRLGVIARTTAVLYKGSPKSADEIGRELGVQYILEGAVRKVGDRVRISAQLIEVSDQSHVWAENYDRDLRDILKAQVDVGEAVANQIQIKLTGSPAAPRLANTEAYEAYLQGRLYLNKGDLNRSVDYLKRAIAKDPNYALAYANLAEAYFLLGATPFNILAPREAWPLAKTTAIKALQLDQKLAEAHRSLARIYLSFDWDWPAAEGELKTALELNPSDPLAHSSYGHYLMIMGRLQEALAEVKRARELDPSPLVYIEFVGEAYYLSRQYDQAIEQCRRALELSSNSLRGLYWLGSAYREKRMYPEAIETFMKARIVSGNNPLMIGALGHVYGVSGNKKGADNALAELKNLSRTRYVPAIYTAAIYTGLGDKDKAFEWLDKAYAEREDRLIFLTVEPLAEPLRSDPRYHQLARRIGLTP